MYVIHQTEGVILKSFDTGEASRRLFIFTKDFGLVGASAQGLREQKSKLRYSLQDLSRARIGFVEGRSGWRVVDAEHVSHFWTALRGGNGEGERHAAVVRRVSQLLCRLLRGEERNEPLYEEVVRRFELFCARRFGEKQIAGAEVILVMRILHHLGYWGENGIPRSFLEGDMSDALIADVGKIRSRAVREINKALKETQL